MIRVDVEYVQVASRNPVIPNHVRLKSRKHAQFFKISQYLVPQLPKLIYISQCK